MKPEYQFKVEKLTDKEQVLSGLLNSGYIVSCQQKFGHYEISVYGKERVDGKGGKSTDWVGIAKDDPNTHTINTPYIKTPYIQPAITYFGTDDSLKVTCNPQEASTITSTIIKAIDTENKDSVGFESRTVLY